MKPYIHAKNSANKYGGVWEDYIKIHNFFDETKEHVPEMVHRIFLHNSFGIGLCEKLFGTTITNSEGRVIAVKSIAEDHVLEDIGWIPTLHECAEHIERTDWMYGSRRKHIIKVTK
jgi:hypothetical protein